MLLACLLLSNTTTWSPIPLRPLLILIATLSVYELLLVASASSSSTAAAGGATGRCCSCSKPSPRRRRVHHSEIAQLDLRVGVYVNAILVLLAVAKLYVIFRVLRVGVASPAFGLCVTMVAALSALPLAIKHASAPQSGALPEQTLYAAWWVAALLAAAYGALMRHGKLLGDLDAGTRRMTHVFLTLPLISLAAHLGTSHWVYDLPFRAPDASPTLLAMAVLLTAITPTALVPRATCGALCVILPVAAVLAALSPARPLTWHALGQQITPIEITVAAAYATLVYCLLLRFARVLFAAGGMAAAAWAFGPSPATVGEWATRLARAGAGFAKRLVPQTQAAWGVVSLASAFLLLAIGAAVSLFRAPPSADDPAAPVTPDRPPRREPASSERTDRVVPEIESPRHLWRGLSGHSPLILLYVSDERRFWEISICTVRRARP
jgi:hypothetical protein